MIGNVLLALGIVLSTASQLRLPAVPLGFGEVCLLLWLGVASLNLMTSGRISNPEAVLRIGAFWISFAFALSVGTCVGLLQQELDPTTALHDTSAYLLMASFTCLIAATMSADGSLRQTQWLLIAAWSIALVIQLAMGWDIISLPSVDPWYWDRFRGWAENPNQMALYCIIFTPLSLGLALSAKGFGCIAASFSCLLSFTVGRLTKSDTFAMAMVAAIAFFLVLRLRTWLTLPERKSSIRFAVAVFVSVTILPLLLSLTPYAVATADNLESLALSLTRDQGGEATVHTASLRVQLWSDAVNRGLKSGSLGLGPGAHLQQPNTMNRQALPIPFEAHSTVLDIYTQAGLLGLIAVCALIVATVVVVLRARHDALAAMIAALAIYGMTHFILRHPIVWFALALSLVLGSARAPSPHVRMRR